MKTLHHLTINTGHVARTSRDDVDEVVIGNLRPMIANYEGGYPALGIGFDLFRPWKPDRTPMQGAAIFNLVPWPKGENDLPFVTAFCCWDDVMSEAVWSEVWDMVSTYRDVMEAAGFPNITTQAIPPEAPWLAVMLFPTAAARLDRDRIVLLGDMERCLFWALAEEWK